MNGLSVSSRAPILLGGGFHNPLASNSIAGAYASRVAFPDRVFTSMTAEFPDLPFSITSFHLSTV